MHFWHHFRSTKTNLYIQIQIQILDYISGYSVKWQYHTYKNILFIYEESLTPHQMSITPGCQIPLDEWDSLSWKSLLQAGSLTNKKNNMCTSSLMPYFNCHGCYMVFIKKKAISIIGINQITLSPKTSLFRKEGKIFVRGFQMKYFTYHTVIQTCIRWQRLCRGNTKSSHTSIYFI